MAKGWRLLAWTHGTACRFGDAAEASERALEHARLADDARQQARAATAYAGAALFGPTPVDEGITRCEQAVELLSGDRQSEAVVLALLASLVAMRGEFDRARDLARRGRALAEELGLDIEVASVALEAWRVEMLAGDIEAAERELRGGYDLLVALGERYFLSTVAGLLGQTVYMLGRYAEAEELGRLARELASDDDVDTQALWRCLQGKLLAQEGAYSEGETLVRQALAILAPTDAVLFTYGALLDLAEVRRIAGQSAEDALAEARAFADAKGSAVLAGAVAAMLARPA
jgi:ATP/maltotriose-dependent transcriptional regulator MalT